jgi:hypothetical protein
MNVWPTVKNVIEIGGLHVHEPRPLSKVRTYDDESTSYFIAISVL